MSWHFNPQKTTQAAAYLVKRSGNGRINYLKLLKLLYFADRQSIAEKGYPLTGDSVWAMDYGPVLTRVYDYIKAQPTLGAGAWAAVFRTDNFEVVLEADPGEGELSRYDMRLLASVYDAHRNLDGFDISELTHEFPEWKQVYRPNTSTRIPLEAILTALELREEESKQLLAQRAADEEYFGFFERLAQAQW